MITRVLLILLIIFLTLPLLHEWLNPTNLRKWEGCVQNARSPCPSRLLLLHWSLGKHANEGGGRRVPFLSCMIGIYYEMNESYCLSLFFLYLFFFLLLKKHHHLRCGQKQWIFAQLLLPMNKKKKKQATCFKCGLNSPEAQAVANRPERVRAWKDKRLLLKRPRMDTKKMAVSVCVFVPVRVSSSAPTGEEELKEEQIYPALTASAYRPLNGWGNKTHKITWICVYSCIASKWLLTDTLTYSNIGAALQFTLCNGVDGKPGGHSALLRTLTHCWVLIDPNV